MKKTLRVEGMSCDHCVRHVSEALKGVSGVKAVDVRLKEKRAIVQGDPLDDGAMRAAVAEAGYEVAGIE